MSDQQHLVATSSILMQAPLEVKSHLAGDVFAITGCFIILYLFIYFINPNDFYTFPYSLVLSPTLSQVLSSLYLKTVLFSLY